MLGWHYSVQDSSDWRSQDFPPLESHYLKEAHDFGIEIILYPHTQSLIWFWATIVGNLFFLVQDFDPKFDLEWFDLWCMVGDVFTHTLYIV